MNVVLRRRTGARATALRVLSGAMAVVFAGIVYFVAVFAVAFALGVARTLVVAPAIGAMAAVLLEMPVVLGASWIVARRVLRDRHFNLSQRAVMGAIAFVLLMASEALLAGVLRGQSIGEWAHELTTPLGLVGLAGQLAFAAMPILVRGD